MHGGLANNRDNFNTMQSYLSQIVFLPWRQLLWYNNDKSLTVWFVKYATFNSVFRFFHSTKIQLDKRS